MGILDKIIDARKIANCNVPIQIPCVGPGSASELPGSIEVIYPTTGNAVIPQFGGSIIKIPLGDVGLNNVKLSDKQISFIRSYVGTYGNSTRDLSKFRTMINKLLFDFKSSMVLLGDTNILPPKMSFKHFNGDDSFLTRGISSPKLNTVCEFKYIPYKFLKEVLFEVLVKDETNTFGNIIGASGFSFLDLHSKLILDDISDQMVISYLIDLVPMFNINDEDITGEIASKAVFGGYYFIINNYIYIKSPDLTGMDSAGNSEFDLNDRASNLYAEFLYRGHLSRVKFDSILPASNGSDAGVEGVIPLTVSSEPVFVSFVSDMLSSEIKNVYLSLQHNRRQNLNGMLNFNGYADIFPAVTMSSPVFNAPGTGSIVNPQDLTSNISGILPPFEPSVIAELSKYYDKDYLTSFNSLSSFHHTDMESTIGEMNDPRYFTVNGFNGESRKRNDKKYFRPSAHGSIPILSQHRPRFFGKIPNMWIKKSNISSLQDGILSIRLTSKDFKFINLSSGLIVGNPRFSIYIEDIYGQLSRVSGPPIEISAPLPEISIMEPNGFSGSLRLTGLSTDSFILSGSGLREASGFRTRRFGSLLWDKFTLFNNPPQNFLFDSKKDNELYFSVNITDIFSSNQSGLYEISVRDFLGRYSSPFLVSIEPDLNVQLIPRVKSPFDFADEVISGIGRFRNGIYGIPILHGSDSIINFKSKSKFFNEITELYMYLAVKSADSGVLSDFSVSTTTLTSSAHGDISIPLDMKYTYGTAAFSGIGKKRASLSFPSSEFSSRNISSFVDLKSFYFVFSTKVIGENDPFSSETMFVLKIGTDSFNPFTLPPLVRGMYVRVDDKNISTSMTYKDAEAIEIASNSTDSIHYKGVSQIKQIQNLSVVFEGIKTSSRMKRKYDFFLNGTLISNKVIGRIRPLERGGLIVKFKKLLPSSDGLLLFEIKKREDAFGVELSSNNMIFKGTIVTNKADFIIDLDGNMIVNNDISKVSSQSVTGFHPKINSNIIETIFRNRLYGFKRVNFGNTYSFFNPITMSSKTNVNISENGFDFISILPTANIGRANRNRLLIPSGEPFKMGSYLLGVDKYLAFFEVNVSDYALIDFNLPKILSISDSENGMMTSVEDGKFNMNPGDKIMIKISSLTRNFEILINSVAVKYETITSNNGTFDVKVTIPDIAITPVCYDICVSTTNKGLLRAQKGLGGAVANNPVEIMDGIKNGITSGAIPSATGLKGLLSGKPLRLGPVLLDSASVPVALINNFCDYSFHLTADLNVALKGFETLMVPVKVIFCIIDVLCSLMNPIKVARAVVRLFECLYDLILLLPQISVPVMYFQLSLHIIELMQCLFSTIIELIYAINKISEAISLEKKKPNDKIDFPAIKALEEVLSEYLYEVEVHMSVLDPVVSIMATFLNLLQLTFRFPCSVSPGVDPICGMDGTMLAGIIAGVVAPNDEILPETLVPVIQPYTTKTIDEAALSSSGSAPFVNPVPTDIIMSLDQDGTYISSIAIDSFSMRGGVNAECTFAPTYTKMSKSLKKSTTVTFQFNSIGENTLFSNRKIIDPLQTMDAPLGLMDIAGLTVVPGTSGLFSPLDGYNFIIINGNTASVNPLTISFDVPRMGLNPATNQIEQISIEVKTRTFDSVPSMAIMDEDFNVYFIEKDGIKIVGDKIVSITATIQNKSSVNKVKFSKENIPFDSNDDGNLDSETPIYDFPQLYFVDMRQIDQQLEQACFTSSLNSFVFDNGDIGVVDAAVQDGSACLDTFVSEIQNITSNARAEMESGVAPAFIDPANISSLVDTLTTCMTDTGNAVCQFVVNPLNTSFRVQNDATLDPLIAYPDVALGATTLDGFAADSQNITGAIEFASGIGDSGKSVAGSSSKIIIIPRDAYDKPIIGDLSDKITIYIVSDTTDGASFLMVNGNYTEYINGEHVANLFAPSNGTVEIRANICGRVIQAVTYDGLISENPTTVSCIPQKQLSAAGGASVGALIKVDRILTVYFTSPDPATTNTFDQSIPITSAQVSGSRLQN